MCDGGGGKPIVDINWERDVEDKINVQRDVIDKFNDWSRGVFGPVSRDIMEQETAPMLKSEKIKQKKKAVVMKENAEFKQRNAILNKPRTSLAGVNTKSRIAGSKFYKAIG